MIKQWILDFYLKILKKNWYPHYLEIKNLDNEEKLLKFQDNALRKLLLHSYNNVPYFHQILKDNDVIKNGNIDLSNFTRIPIMTKETIRSEEIISKDYTNRKWYFNTSGGSTGEPARFVQDQNFEKWYRATHNYYFMNMLDIDVKNAKKIELWGDYRDFYENNMLIKTKIYYWLTNTLFFNSFNIIIYLFIAGVIHFKHVKIYTYR